VVNGDEIRIGKKYNIYFYLSEEVGEFSFDNYDKQILIDGGKNKIKLIFEDEISIGFGSEGISEIILHKR
jgi:hypothetical protein